MCHYWATTFPCGCFTYRSSGYDFCPKRGTKDCQYTLTRFVWKTFCPASRKALKGKKKYTTDIRLPACCDSLSFEDCETLCLKNCDSLRQPGNGPVKWACPTHLEQVSKGVDADAATVFEQAVELWPDDHRRRYLRRKADKSCKSGWWSV
ncbi:hypothetical protein HD806DRAFT_539253 [Xylariaceae sp. AK1471]|nr:hypothetical protein HD806DRAFT_539253 [Xylariaceae sp. AK1471]